MKQFKGLNIPPLVDKEKKQCADLSAKTTTIIGCTVTPTRTKCKDCIANPKNEETFNKWIDSMKQTEVKVGQVWQKNSTKKQYKVVAITPGYYHIVCVTEDEPPTYGTPDELYRFTLISDPDKPWLPLPDGYRLVTDEERAKYKKPTYYYCFNDRWYEYYEERGPWVNGFKYAVPTNHVWAEDKASVLGVATSDLKAGDPVYVTTPGIVTPSKVKLKYKLFELVWKDNDGDIKDEINPHYEDGATGYMGYLTSDGYRIFGYGDETDMTVVVEDDDYDVVPCDAERNYKYAYGRLEG